MADNNDPQYYYFTLYPEDYRPSGYINLSTIHEKFSTYRQAEEELKNVQENYIKYYEGDE
jgi:hypothetical protein